MQAEQELCTQCPYEQLKSRIQASHAANAAPESRLSASHLLRSCLAANKQPQRLKTLKWPQRLTCVAMLHALPFHQSWATRFVKDLVVDYYKRQWACTHRGKEQRQRGMHKSHIVTQHRDSADFQCHVRIKHGPKALSASFVRGVRWHWPVRANQNGYLGCKTMKSNTTSTSMESSG